MSDRFVITTVTGFWNAGARASSEGMSAHVLDTAYNYAVVATFRSEQSVSGKGWGGKRLGKEGAMEAAQAAARSLNALHSDARR